MTGAPRIGVVLSSGGGRGVYAHTGFLLALEEMGVPVSACAGCSAGAVVGGIAASGTWSFYGALALKLPTADETRGLGTGVIHASARVFDLLNEFSRLDRRLGCATARSQNGSSQKGAHTQNQPPTVPAHDHLLSFVFTSTKSCWG